MTTIELPAGIVHLDGTARPDAADAAVESRAPRIRPRGVFFWICRYLPAEIAGTAAMVLAGLGVTVWTDSPPLIALAALVGEILGFYVVLALTVYGEQWAQLQHGAHSHRRALLRTAGLLIAEFGAAELLDTLLVRPAALLLGVWLFGPLWGMIAGKIVADLVFYSIAAGAFTVTVKTGLRRAHPAAPEPVPEG